MEKEQKTNPIQPETWEEEFDEKFLKNVKNNLGWNLPRIALYWEESGKTLEWEDMEKELKDFTRSLLATQKKNIEAEIVSALRKEYGGDFFTDGIKTGQVLHKLGILQADKVLRGEGDMK